MSDENQEVVVEPQAAEENAAPPEGEVTATEDQQPEAQKTFTQEELDAIVQKRISKLERKLERQRIESETRAQVTQELSAKQEIPGKPTIDQFNTIEEYTEALTDWKAEQKYSEIKEREQRAGPGGAGARDAGGDDVRDELGAGVIGVGNGVGVDT